MAQNTADAQKPPQPPPTDPQTGKPTPPPVPVPGGLAHLKFGGWPVQAPLGRGIFWIGIAAKCPGIISGTWVLTSCPGCAPLWNFPTQAKSRLEWATPPSALQPPITPLLSCRYLISLSYSLRSIPPRPSARSPECPFPRSRASRIDDRWLGDVPGRPEVCRPSECVYGRHLLLAIVKLH